MKQNKLLYLIGETDDDLILDAAPNREKKDKIKWIKPLAFAASFVFLVSAALGGYAITAEAAEYREAVEFFEEHELSTEGLSREEIKKVYLDIKLQTFSYDKTLTAMLTGTRTDIHDTVCRTHGIFVMFHHNQCITEIAQMAQCL